MTEKEKLDLLIQVCHVIYGQFRKHLPKEFQSELDRAFQKLLSK